VSYWEPMLPGDAMTSGTAWFDYNRGVFRIDGLINPWDEESTGVRQWVSETNFYDEGVSYRWTVDYARESARYEGRPLSVREARSSGCIVPADILRRHQAIHVGEATILCVASEGWRFERPGDKGTATYWFRRGERILLRMVSGDRAVHASIRDFPTFDQAPIPAAVFRRPE